MADINPAPTVPSNIALTVNAASATSINLANLFSDTEPLSYAITSGVLPVGLSLINGVISGNVQPADVAAPTSVNITASDSTNQRVSTSLKLYVSELGAVFPANVKRTGNTLTIELLVDETQDPNGGGMDSLNVTVGYDASKLHYLSSAGYSSILFVSGTASELGTVGTIDLGWAATTPLTGHLAKVISVSFTVLQEGDFKFDVTPTDFDAVNLSSKATHAWLGTLGNQAPTLSNLILDQSTTENVAFSFAVPANTFTDADGDTLTYTALRSDGAALPSWLSFSASTSTFSGTPTRSDIGVVNVRVTAHDGGNAIASDDFALTVAVINHLPSGAISVSGTPTQNQTLSAVSTLADADGLGALSYAWKANGAAIPNATGSTLVLAEAQVGKAITVTASYTDGYGTAESVTGTATAAVANVNDAPTGAVSISGTQSKYQTLTAETVTLGDPDGLGTFSYQWQAATTANGTYANIANATSKTYTLVLGDIGRFIRVVTSYTDAHGTVEAVNSAATGAILDNQPPTGSVAINGIMIEDGTVTASNTIADADGLGTISYQWKANGTSISGATASTLVLAQAQVGKTITVTASYTDGHGTAESVTSSATGAVVNVNDAPTLTSGATGTAAENAAIGTVAYTATGTDPDGDSLTYSLGGADAALFNIVAATGVVTFKTSPNFEAPTDVGANNVYDITVTASDGALLSAAQAVSISVTNVNEAPIQLHPLPDQSASTSAAFNYLLHGFVDPDAGALTYTATKPDGSALPAWLQFNGTTGTFSGTPTANDSGTVAVHVTARDSALLSLASDFNISVSNNAAPVVAANTALAVTAGSATSLNLASLFTDTDALTYAITSGSLPVGLSLANGVISGTVLPANVAVPAVVNITATDTIGQQASTALKLYVSEVGAVQVNKISGGATLVLDFLVDEALNPGGLIPGLESLGVTVQYDSTKLHYVSSAGVAADLFLGGVASEVAGKGSIDIGEAWLATPVTGHPGRVMQVTFNVLQAGDVKIDILPTEFDGNDLSSKATHVWLAGRENRPPVVSNVIVDQSTIENLAYSFVLPTNTFTDADGDALTYTANTTNGSALPTWLSFNASTRTFSGIPGSTDVGVINARVTAHDSSNAVASDDFALTVGVQNHAPTGLVSINGTATQGEILAASNTLADVDGLGTISYQWKANGSNISGATGSTLVLAEAQVGKTVSVAAGYTDGRGTAESVTSNVTVMVVNANDAPSGAVTLSGIATQGQNLTATNNLSDIDGLGALSYQWKANGGNIVGATSTTLVLTEAQVGKTISVTASYTDGHGTAESISSTATAAVSNINDAPSGSVAISGVATQNQTLIAANTLADIDGLGVISYQWKANGTSISGATAGTLVLAEAQVGKVISVVASYTDGHGTAEAVASSATGAVANINDLPTGTVTLSGIATQGQTLTAANTLADMDGLGSVSYQWKANGSNIGGATASALVLSEAQVGKTIAVTASFVDGHGTAESVSSPVSAAVENLNDAPTGLVTIAGIAAQNQTLTATNTLADPDGMGPIAYQWKADGNVVSGATSATLVLTEAQVGRTLSVSANYVDGHGTAESVSSNASIAVANVNDLPTGAVTVSGNATQNQVLSAANTLADIDGLGVINYQWKANGTAIAGATFSTLALGEAQVGKAITLTASYIDGHGTAESVTSNPTGAVINVNDLPTGTVTLSGTPTQGQTLTAANSLNDLDGLGALSYQWRADGSAIVGATASTFSPGELQVGKAISVAVSYTDGHGTAEAVASTATAAVTNANMAPVLSGLAIAPAYTERGAPVVLASAAQVDDADLIVTGRYTGASLTLARHGGANPQDLFAPTAHMTSLSEGVVLVVGNAIIGTVTQNSGGTLVLQFNANATQALVNTALEGITYGNSSHVPPTAVVIDWTFNDGNTGVQGPGGPLAGTGSVAVNITPVNDLPTGTDRTVSTDENVPYVLSVSDFGFNDAEDGTTPSGIRVDTLPAAGNLRYDNAGLFAGLTLSVADIQAGKVSYTAAPDSSGMHYANFQFRVLDSEGAYSAAPNTLSVDVIHLNRAPTGGVNISGTATQNQTLTAANTLADSDGLGAITYQWQASSDGAAWNNLSAGATLMLTEAQVGRQIRVLASYTDGFGTAESVASGASGAVANVNDPGLVQISGTATQGETLTATTSDADGPGSVNYQWRADGNIIAGANGPTLVLAQAQVGKVISVTAGYTDGHGSVESVTSSGTGAVVNVNDAPVAGTMGNPSVGARTPMSLNPGLLFSDVDSGDVLTYTASGLTPGLSISASTGQVSGIAPSSTGVHHITVTGTDGGGLSAQTSFDLIVTGIPFTANVVTRGGLPLPGVTAHEFISTTPEGSLYAFNNFAVEANASTGIKTLSGDFIATGSSSEGALSLTFQVTAGAGFQSFDLTGPISSANGWTIVTNTGVTNSHGIAAINLGVGIAADTLIGKLTLTLPATASGNSILDLVNASLGSADAPSRGLVYSQVDLGASGHSSTALSDGNLAISLDRGIGDYLVAGKRPITAIDALDALRLSVGRAASEGNSWKEMIAADFNHDGRVSANDALEILKITVGMNTLQPFWVFVPDDPAINPNLGSMTKNTATYKDDFNLSSLAAPGAVSFTGILVGDVNNSWLIPA